MSERAIFIAALEKDDPAERAAFLDQACADDRQLRQRIERLLRAHEPADSFLEHRPPGLGVTVDEPPLAERPGTVIGPYKLLQQIGEGGMGVVYMAEQEKPVRRQVALKIIKPGMDSKQVVARFETERQALAMMDHTNIARVFDAGTTESGRPYFVMELVHGVPITEYCDANQLTPHQRLALFIPVCQAIQHAHQKGIVHRDVKPSNILVTMYDDKPVPKVIDFGVAKAVEQRLTEKTLFTQFGALVGTFEYMSPEQAEMNAFGVDTRSDIYSLGVLLYELLTGTTPLERQRLREAALGELVRLIKEEEAPRPSVRLSTSNNLPKIAAARRTEPAQLSRLVRGEIDWIVMKCLEKDRARRYDTASGLARDVERYLADEPVEACPPSARYRLRKFARKHRKALVTAAAFAVLLVAGLVLSTSLAVWATSAEREANRQRIVSEEARQEAQDAKGEADKQRDEARLTAYASGMQLAQRAWEENNVVLARELLEEVPKEAAGQDLRGFEWYYLDRLCHSEALTLQGRDGMVMSVAFSPDGLRLASGSTDGTVRTWDSATGKELLSLKGHADRVTSVAFSPDGRRLASGSHDRTVRIWDSATGKELFALKGHADVVWSVAFSPDGRRLASGSNNDGTVKVWDSATGKELRSRQIRDGAVFCVAFSPDGQWLASVGSDRMVMIWDSGIGEPDWFANCLKGHTDGVFSVAFSPDGRRLASGSHDRTVRIWDRATGKELFSLKGHAGWVNSVAFSPDGQRLASASADGTVKIWDIATSNERFSLKGHTWQVFGVAFSPDGRRLASASGDGTVRTWDSATGKELLSLKGHVGVVFGVAFSPDGRRLTSAGGGDQTVRIWDSATGKELLSLKGHSGPVLGVAFSPDGRRLASGHNNDGTVTIWDSTTGKELLRLQHVKKGHMGAVFGVAFSPDGRRLASAGGDRKVRIWDSATGEELLSLPGHTDGVESVTFSPDGRRLASAGGGDLTVTIWDSATGKALLSLKGHASDVRSVAFSPDGRRLASGSQDQTVRVWDTTTGKELLTLKGRAGAVRSVAFSPDGGRLASANEDGSIDLWETSVSPEVQERRAAEALMANPKPPGRK